MAARRRIHQGFQGLQQSGINFGQRLATAPEHRRRTPTASPGFARRCSKFTDSGRDGIPRQPCSSRDSCDTAPTERAASAAAHCLRIRSSITGEEREVLLSNPFDRYCVLHARNDRRSVRFLQDQFAQLFFSLFLI